MDHDDAAAHTASTSTHGDRHDLLEIYLTDHAAGATAGAQRARRLAEAERTSNDAASLATLATDIDLDREALLALMEVLRVEPSRVKNAVASVGERLGVLKPNGRIATRSPLSTVVELEALQMAVRGKRSLWETLSGVVPVGTPIKIESLIERADAQLTTLSEIHAKRVATTFPPTASKQEPGA